MSNLPYPDEGLRVLVVDDEELACRNLRRKLLSAGGVGWVETTTDPLAAVAFLRDTPPDLVFLDVKMPGLSGFDILAQFPEHNRAFLPIFCTAFDNYATRAFEAAALDYLVKPVDPIRLAATLARSRRNLESLRLTAPCALESSDLTRARAAGVAGWLERIVVRFRGGATIVEVSDIAAIASEAHQAVAYTSQEEHVLESSLTTLEAQLDPRRFARTHRAWLVQLAYVQAVEADSVRLRTGRTLPLSRRNKTAFLEAWTASCLTAKPKRG